MNGFSPVRITWFGSAAIGGSLCWAEKQSAFRQCPEQNAIVEGALRAFPPDSAPVTANAPCYGGDIAAILPRLHPNRRRADADRIVDLEHAERTQDQRRARRN